VWREAKPGAAWQIIAGKMDPRSGEPIARQGERGSALPQSAPAAGFAFDRSVHVIGQRADSSLILVDGPVVWSLRGGTLTQIYHDPSWHPMTVTDQRGFPGTVASDGTVVLGTDDGGWGRYFRINDHFDFLAPQHQYVLHEKSAHWDVVAAAVGVVDQLSHAKLPSGTSVSALGIPVPLPISMVVRPGMLVLSDPYNCNYALAVGLPR
jgi:hypothetical protein